MAEQIKQYAVSDTGSIIDIEIIEYELTEDQHKSAINEGIEADLSVLESLGYYDSIIAYGFDSSTEAQAWLTNYKKSFLRSQSAIILACFAHN